MSKYSRYVLIVEGLSTYTRSSDIRKEMERYGPVEEVERDRKERCALVEFRYSDDASYAYRKAEGTRMDGRKWRVDYANRKDFDFFGWKWTEGSSSSRSRSRSRSRSTSPLPRSVSPGAERGSLEHHSSY